MIRRIACCVPFCRRTRGHRKGDPITPGMEWVCQAHFLAVPEDLRRIHRRAKRRCRAAWREYDVMTDAKKYRAATLATAAEARLWARLKRAAIEAAGGIG